MAMRPFFALTVCFALLMGSLGTPLLGFESQKPQPNPLVEGSHFKLVVVGGSPEGIAAAVSAARNGVSTLLIEEASELGGLMTLGRLNFLDMNYGPEKELLTRGIFEEFYLAQGNAFDIRATKKYFLELVKKEPQLSLKLGTRFLAPLMEGSRIVGVKVQEQGRIKTYSCQWLIDATPDADVAAAAGVPFTLGTEDYGYPDKNMGATLVFRVKGVNWPYVYLYNNFQRLLSKIKPQWGDPYAGAKGKVAWGYGQQALEYQAKDPQMRFRGPNLARQDDHTVLLNALLIFGIDPLDPASKQEGIERGKRELASILAFMQERFPGFKKAEIVDVAEELYIRESRHIQGEYRLTIDDVLENRDHGDRIAHGSYPVDLQPAGPEDLGNVIGKPAIYSVPFRSLVPLKIDNLLVVGRSASYDSLAAGSARVLPVGMCVGEAAGVATAYALNNEVDFREMSRSPQAVQAIQERLHQQGAYLRAFEAPRIPVMDHWAYPGLKTVRALGLAAGGYSNDYGLDQPIQSWDANYLFAEVLARRQKFTKFDFPGNITKDHLLITAVEVLYGEKMAAEDCRNLLEKNGLLTDRLLQHFRQGQTTPTFGELYMLLDRVYGALKG